ncbi:hypothetical protein NECAME_09747 [Necator americanus]|uniref:Uncharacterized protein n=1 Tax=Necator americanus TaxID=51031 RepID=W2TEE4_NECAM|nr:hypothetical protein NECAME_09747 [Necator americanus]ETN79571.1 hypothetical protein NECAME_09747 [Necator americanus]
MTWMTDFLWCLRKRPVRLRSEFGTCITSYGYFAPVSEVGDITQKSLGNRSWIKNIPTCKNGPLDFPDNDRSVPLTILIPGFPDFVHMSGKRLLVRLQCYQ